MTERRGKLREFHCHDFKWADGTITTTILDKPHPEGFVVREVDPEREAAIEKMVEAIRYYSEMRFNRDKQEWMPAGPDKAINALALWERVK